MGVRCPPCRPRRKPFRLNYKVFVNHTAAGSTPLGEPAPCRRRSRRTASRRRRGLPDQSIRSSTAMPWPCLSAVRNHRIAVRLPSESVSALRFRNRVQPSGRWLDTTCRRDGTASALRKAAFKKVAHAGSALTTRHYAVRGAEFLREYLLLKALALVRARSLFVDLIDGLTPSGPV
jgi:hypothetical protein